MTDSGVRVMLARRGEQAGSQNVHPHPFRRSFADKWLAGGGSTDDLMRITGWKTYGMVREYTEGRGIARAHDAHARLSLGDRIWLARGVMTASQPRAKRNAQSRQGSH